MIGTAVRKEIMSLGTLLDGWGPYIPAMNTTFRDSVDYAQLVKIYGNLPAVARRLRSIAVRRVDIQGRDRES